MNLENTSNQIIHYLSKIPAPDVIIRILSAQLLVARLGEKDIFSWWNSWVLSRTGALSLEIPFPKTHSKARLNLGLEAASIREQSLLPPNGKVRSLFLFSEPVEQTISRVRHQLVKNPELLKNTLTLLEEIEIDETEELSGITSAFSIPTSIVSEVRSIHRTSPLCSFCIGKADREKADEQTIEVQFQQLLAGYLDNKRGRLQVPYFELIG